MTTDTTPGVWTLEAYIAHNEAMRIVGQEALALQAKEYERRLEGLNHENARISIAADKSVNREFFDATIKPIEDFIVQAQGRVVGTQDSRSTIAWIAALIASLIAIGSFVFRPIPTAPAATAPQIIYTPAPFGTLIPSTPTQNPAK